METPENDRRRSIRTALVELPTYHGVLSVIDQEGRRLNNNDQNTILAEPTSFINGSTPTGLLSPSPSPDEMIIRQRGRRRIPATFSPDIDEIKKNRAGNQKDRTPVKISNIGASSIVRRSTPRKRLILSEDNIGDSESLSPTKISPKKLKLDRGPGPGSSFEEIEGKLKACTSNQLISVIQQMLIKRPDMEKDLTDIIPKPDLRALESHLLSLKRNVCKALPTNRLCSKTDAIAYHRASAHLANFKKSINDYGVRFTESKQWGTVVEFVVIAWKIVRTLPVFENPAHNSLRKQCFKFLASQCVISLKNGDFSSAHLNIYESKLKSFISDSDEMKPVLIFLESIIPS